MSEIQRYELGVDCGMYCLGGMATLTKTDYPDDNDVVKITDHLSALAAAAEREKVLVEALTTARVGLFHEAPESCWATGPMTGNDYEDLIVCPGCRGIQAIDAAFALVKP